MNTLAAVGIPTITVYYFSKEINDVPLSPSFRKPNTYFTRFTNFRLGVFTFLLYSEIRFDAMFSNNLPATTPGMKVFDWGASI